MKKDEIFFPSKIPAATEQLLAGKSETASAQLQPSTGRNILGTRRRSTKVAGKRKPTPQR